MRPEEIDDLLRSEAELAWRPELTAAVMVGVRRERARMRWRLWAAAALILLAAGLGGMVLRSGLETTGIGPEIASRVPPPRAMTAALDDAGLWLATRLETVAAPLEFIPGSPGVAVAVAALILLLIVNGATLGRPALARRRNP